MDTYIKDASGNIRYIIRKSGSDKSVYDRNGNLLGHIRNGFTYNKGGTLVSRGEDPSILVLVS